MTLKLSPIMLSLLATTLPTAPATTWAAEHGQIIINDPTGNTRSTLDANDTVTYSGSGAAIDVSVSGNTLNADKITVNTSNGSIGIRAKAGGRITLSNSTINTVGTSNPWAPNNHGLQATGQGSSIVATNMRITTNGPQSYGISAQSGGRIELDGGTINTINTDFRSHGIEVNGAGSSILAKNLNITTAGEYGSGAYVQNGNLTLEDVTINASGRMADGIYVDYYNSDASLVTLRNVDITSEQSRGLSIEAGKLTMDGGTITTKGFDAVWLGAKTTASLSNAKLIADGRFVYGLNINSAGAAATLNHVSIFVRGSDDGTGVWLPAPKTSLTATNFDIDSSGMAIDSRQGRVQLKDGSITTHDAYSYGLYISADDNMIHPPHSEDTYPTLNAKNVQVKTVGNNAFGAFIRLMGAEAHFEDSSITTTGDLSYGLYADRPGAKLTSLNTTVRTSGEQATGLLIGNRADVSLDSSHFIILGKDARGIWSLATTANSSNAFSLTNGSSISTQDGAALLTTGGDHTITLDNVSIVGRTAGKEANGALLHSSSLSLQGGGMVFETDQVILDAARSTLTGDVVMDSGTANIRLNNNSVLTGALIERGGRINSMAVDNASVWNVRGDSSLHTLSNTGIVAFSAPGANDDFKTLTVNDYVGNGTLVMNTVLGDDTSLTDRLIIDGGSTSGNTALRILNAGGVGAATNYGITLVSTINGGTTTTDAFHLDSGSTGYRSGSDTVAINGYDYSLLRGGNGGVEHDWYLTSAYTPPVEPPVKPTDPSKPPVTPLPPIEPPVIVPPVKPPVAPSFQNVSPESGAYIGNQLAATRLFTHRLSDRSTMANDTVNVGNHRYMWMRALARHDSGLRMAEGHVRIKTTSTLLQLGGEILRGSVGKEGALYAGVMAGYGDASTHSTSRLRIPGTIKTSAVRARGKTSGYSVGVYGTYYQNDHSRLGAYGDTWLQYGRYANNVSSELGSARYHATVWSASVESGYAFQPFSTTDSALRNLVVVPNAQVMYSHYDADNAALQGTTIQSGNTSTWLSRAGVRLQTQATPGNTLTITPFVEANWLYSNQTPSVHMGTNTLDARAPRHALELRVGLQGRLSQKVDVSAQLFGQTGSQYQRGYGGMVKMGYRW